MPQLVSVVIHNFISTIINNFYINDVTSSIVYKVLKLEEDLLKGNFFPNYNNTIANIKKNCILAG